ncbi:MAG: ATP-binding protein [Thermoplasmata archaeon]|nr:ATP-binding protein [Thermoplasmata archaeon]
MKKRTPVDREDSRRANPSIAVPPRPVLLAIEGVSGAGKSTLARELSTRTGWPLLEEAWWGQRPRRSLAIPTPARLRRLEADLLREESRRFARARRWQRSGRSVILDTGVLGPLTYVRGLGEIWGPEWDVRGQLPRGRVGSLGLADVHVFLKASPTLSTKRARISSTTHPEAWRERHAQIGRTERTFWLRTVPRLAPGRVWTVRAGPAPEVLATRLLRRLASDTLPPVRPSEERRVLDFLWRGALGSPPRNR